MLPYDLIHQIGHGSVLLERLGVDFPADVFLQAHKLNIN
jgi:hypothetical protein